MIKNLTYNLNKILLTNEVLNSYVLQFWGEAFTFINKDSVKHLMVLCKVKYSSTPFAETGEEIEGNYKINLKKIKQFYGGRSSRI